MSLRAFSAYPKRVWTEPLRNLNSSTCTSFLPCVWSGSPHRWPHQADVRGKKTPDCICFTICANLTGYLQCFIFNSSSNTDMFIIVIEWGEILLRDSPLFPHLLALIRFSLVPVPAWSTLAPPSRYFLVLFMPSWWSWNILRALWEEDKIRIMKTGVIWKQGWNYRVRRKSGANVEFKKLTVEWEVCGFTRKDFKNKEVWNIQRLKKLHSNNYPKENKPKCEGGKNPNKQ